MKELKRKSEKGKRKKVPLQPTQGGFNQFHSDLVPAYLAHQGTHTTQPQPIHPVIQKGAARRFRRAALLVLLLLAVFLPA
jgi:hypothetical protein